MVRFKSNKFWILVLGGIVLLSAVLMVFFWNIPANYAKIYHDGELTETVNLSAVTEPFLIHIKTQEKPPVFDGVINIVEAEQGRIRMIMADCPDGLCVRMGWISSSMIPIVCLPNRVVIILESADTEHDVDAVVG